MSSLSLLFPLYRSFIKPKASLFNSFQALIFPKRSERGPKGRVIAVSNFLVNRSKLRKFFLSVSNSFLTSWTVVLGGGKIDDGTTGT